MLLISQLGLAVVLTVATTVYTYLTRFRGLKISSILLPPEPHQAIIIIQLLMFLSVKAILQAFLMCLERLRWILAAGGIPALTFHILGAPTGFWALVSIIFAKTGRKRRSRIS